MQTLIISKVVLSLTWPKNFFKKSLPVKIKIPILYRDNVLDAIIKLVMV